MTEASALADPHDDDDLEDVYVELKPVTEYHNVTVYAGGVRSAVLAPLPEDTIDVGGAKFLLSSGRWCEPCCSLSSAPLRPLVLVSPPERYKRVRFSLPLYLFTFTRGERGVYT